MPPASGPSRMIASAVLSKRLAQPRRISAAPRAELTIGTRLTDRSWTILGSLIGSPAPKTIIWIPSWTAVRRRSSTLLSTPIKLTARPPWVMARALRISSRKASREIRSYSCRAVSKSPRPMLEMVPIPPSSATAAARDASDTLTPIPPWMIGISAVRSPI